MTPLILVIDRLCAQRTCSGVSGQRGGHLLCYQNAMRNCTVQMKGRGGVEGWTAADVPNAYLSYGSGLFF